MPIQKALQENPHRGEDMLVTFEVLVSFEANSDKWPLRLTYIPDRDILQEKDFTKWVQKLSKETWTSPEAFINALSATFYNEVLPYFLDIKLEITRESGSLHKLEAIKSQPQYKIPGYLERKI